MAELNLPFILRESQREYKKSALVVIQIANLCILKIDIWKPSFSSLNNIYWGTKVPWGINSYNDRPAHFRYRWKEAQATSFEIEMLSEAVSWEQQGKRCHLLRLRTQWARLNKIWKFNIWGQY